MKFYHLEKKEPKESQFCLDEIRQRFSGVLDDLSLDNRDRFWAEINLCLANEIEALKKEIQRIKDNE